jgi:dCTP deaminase
MATLSKGKIEEYMKKPLKERLVITPIFNWDEQLGDGALDVRLGNQFIITQRTSFPGIDPGRKEATGDIENPGDALREDEKKSRAELKLKIGQYQRKINVGFYEPFVLHPNQLVLGSTLEYIALPNNLSAYVAGRSTWGRLGLVIATATFVNPGFKGCLTLEIENIGEVPLTVYPGLRIAQLVFHTLEGEGKYGDDRKYLHPTGPQFPTLDDKDLGFWTVNKDKEED